jgi:hypothetical protein
MRNIDKLLLLPLFAALAISCSSPTSLQTSEYDDVYYSKKDKTIITDNTAQAAESSPEAAADETVAANPEYSQKNSGGGAADTGADYYSPGYYDEDDYYYASRIRRFNAPYRGLSYYDFAYTDYYWYNRNPIYYGRSIYSDPFYAYGDPFFYPCYTCYGYPPLYGGISIVIGRPYYNRWGWGNPYYGGLSRGWYGGYGGYGGYYANTGWYRNDTNFSRNVQYGPRRDRSVVPGTDRDNSPNRQRRDISNGGVSGGGGIVQPGDGNLRTTRSTRGRATDTNTGDITQPEDSRNGTRGRVDRSEEGQPAGLPEIVNPRRSTRGRGAELESVPAAGEDRVIQPRMDEAPARGRDRRGFEPRSSESQPVYQPRQERRSEPVYQPRQEQQRSEPVYQPRQERRSEPVYQAPQRQERTYSPPSTPSYNPPSRPSGGGGGGSSDGGGRSSRGRGN